MAEDINVPFLGEIPLVQSIRESGDVGRPAAMQTATSVESAFEELTRNVVRELVNRNTDLPPTEAIKITTMAGCSAVKKKITMTAEETKRNVEKALDEIRPFLQSDGGDISLISIDNDTSVKVRLEGACIGCSVNQMTLKSGVEMTIKKYAPQIEEVISVQ